MGGNRTCFLSTLCLDREYLARLKLCKISFVLFSPFFQGSNFTNPDLTSRPTQVWEDPQKSQSPESSGSALTSATATKRPFVEEEEDEGNLSIEEEGFELLNYTYNKITGPGRPGVGRSNLKEARNTSESLTSVTSVSPTAPEDAQVANEDLNLPAASIKVNRLASKKQHILKTTDENITTEKLKGDMGIWTSFSPSKPVDTIVDLDRSSAFSKVSIEESETAASSGNMPRLLSSISHGMVEVPVGRGMLENHSKASGSRKDALNPPQTPLDARLVHTRYRKRIVHQRTTGTDTKDGTSVDRDQRTGDRQLIRVKPGPPGPRGPPGLPVSGKECVHVRVGRWRAFEGIMRTVLYTVGGIGLE